MQKWILSWEARSFIWDDLTTTLLNFGRISVRTGNTAIVSSFDDDDEHLCWFQEFKLQSWAYYPESNSILLDLELTQSTHSRVTQQGLIIGRHLICCQVDYCDFLGGGDFLNSVPRRIFRITVLPNSRSSELTRGDGRAELTFNANNPLISSARSVAAPAIPQACLGCENFHGTVYGGNMFVCAMHPYGWQDDEDCPDRVSLNQ